MVARVTLEIALRREFDYAIPPELAGQVEVGTRVKVPFGHRQVMGCVTALVQQSTHTNLRHLTGVVGKQSLVTARVLQLARWIADYYCCAPEIALKSVLPEVVRREQDGWRERLFVRLLPVTGDPPKLTKRQQEILNLLEERRELPLQELLELAETTAETVRRLEDKHLVLITNQVSERDPYAKDVISRTESLTMNAEQAKALEQITAAMDGSGSTRVSRVAGGVPPPALACEVGNAPAPALRSMPAKPDATNNPTPSFRRDAENNPRDAGATRGSSASPGSAWPLVSEATVRRRLLPHLEVPGATYHLVWRTQDKLTLTPAARQATLDACHFWHSKKLHCKIACVMPDHVHLIVQPVEERGEHRVGTHSLTEILHSIKSFSAHQVNKLMNRKGPVWQDESYDRMVRSEGDLHEKWNYIWNNPRELGLVGPMEEYPYIWTPKPGVDLATAERVPDASGSTRVSRVAGGVPPPALVCEVGSAPAPALRSPPAKPDATSNPTPSFRRDAENYPRDAGATRASSSASAKPHVFLLHGVTGSGKTEVYLQAIAHALAQGKGAIVLVPEIALTPQTVERFKARFSHGALQTQVAVLHSHLSAGERHDEWHKIRQGRARIVIGARSAIFAPVEPLGLIIVDEEHEHSYKQEEAPRYHARDVAVVRGQMDSAVVVLGSATPSMESFYNVQRGKYALLELPTRADDKKMPIVRVVDMRQAARKDKGTPIFSEELKEAITKRLERKEQTMLFLNRRGYSSSLQCPQCGFVAECPNCSVALTYHRRTQKICCHICGHEAPAPTACPEPKCRSAAIRYAGLGTERVEETLTKLFPHARIARMDSDLMKRKEDYRRVLGDFKAGKTDILVGTQMIAKGLHFENVTLVGVIHADLSLHIPDFRAGERTFQLLTQVAGRAGRGDVEGEVFVQSFTPFHPAIQYARRHDYTGFYDQEIEFREQLNYPPAGRLAMLTFKGRNEEKVKLMAEHVTRELESLAGGSGAGEKARKRESETARTDTLELLPLSHSPTLSPAPAPTAPLRDLVLAGPAPAPLLRAETFYRYQLMLRTKQMPRVSKVLATLLERIELPEDVTLTVDVDPVSLM